MANQQPMQIRPDPDPTLLTTQQLLREMANLKELVFSRLQEMDKAVQLLQANADKSPTIAVVAQQLHGLQQLHQEKFDGIEKQFKERDTRTEETAALNQKAIDAALQAAKELVAQQNASNALAIGKNETTTIKQLDGINTLIALKDAANQSRYDDLKERQSLNEGRSKGIGDGWGYLVGGLGIVISIITVVVLLLKQAH